jgi:transcription elongation factor GreA
VDLEDENGGKITYQIVGQDEADIKKNKISVLSPISRSLVGKRTGDEVEVNAPKGKITYVVIQIRYV